MDFQLLRGSDLEEIFELASAELEAPDAAKLSDHECKMRPTRTARNKGAQPYGLAVSLEVERATNLYAEMESDSQLS